MGIEPDVGSIAVLRANGIGDYVFALPALDALRAAYPEARITLLGLPWHERFLGHRPRPIDCVAVLPAPPEAGRSAAADAFWMAQKDERYDLAIQLHGGGRHSNPLVAGLGARLTIGSRCPEALPLDRWVAYRVRHHEVLRWLEVVALAGADPAASPPRLAVTDADREAARRVLPYETSPLVVVCPGAGDARRRWPAARFGVVAARLAETGAKVVVTGDRSDATLAARVVDASGGAALDLSGTLDLGSLTGLLARSALVLGNDTGPLHVARAVGAATVGIYWGVNLVHAAPLRSDRHAVAVAWDHRCPICGADLADLSGADCGHDETLLASVSDAEVTDLALQLLARA